MTTFERIKELTQKRSITLKQLSENLDFGESTIYKWKNQEPKIEYLEKVADYFNVSVDYLLGRTDSSTSNIQKKSEETELRKALENVMSFDGEEMTESDKEAIIAYMMGRKSK